MFGDITAQVVSPSVGMAPGETGEDMKALTIILVILLVILILISGFCFGVAWRDSKVAIDPVKLEVAIATLEGARDSHQYFVDKPELIWWAEDSSQDAEWVERYNSIIRLLEESRR